ncbi:hypothetical protein [Chondromyces crocatus]|uniref:Uncharacterized protein n=1 Tax=Chondromyces crocatus TaxID=52 RepID=A0A0K1EGQ9_CHOCO|nr:hypothetical protein [Chondromyces crocatus]AKT40034.1 uncharacterized protein CMC5_041870 [Chondromyces crocatus]
MLGGAACGGPPTASPVEGEPVCADFEFGASRARMRGSLRLPVQVTILDGKDVLNKMILDGRREQETSPSQVLIPDTNGEFEVQWAQCVNEPAPRPVAKTPDQKGDTPAYECGETTPYKTETISVRRGDATTRKLTFATPPKLDCWAPDAPAAAATAEPAAPPPPPPAATAAPDAAPDGGTPPDAGSAATADGTATPAATAAPSAEPSAAPTATPKLTIPKRPPGETPPTRPSEPSE